MRDSQRHGPRPLALLQTNRMLRSEASSIFYKEFAPFEQIPFAHRRETPDVVVNRIHALCKLLAMHDVKVRITVLCLLDREGCMSENECWEAGFSARMLPGFIAEETGRRLSPSLSMIVPQRVKEGKRISIAAFVVLMISMKLGSGMTSLSSIRVMVRPSRPRTGAFCISRAHWRG